MVVGEDGGLAVEFVDVGSLDDRVSVASEVAVALVIGNDEDNIGLLCGESQSRDSKVEYECLERCHALIMELRKGRARMKGTAMKLAVLENRNWGKMTCSKRRRRRQKPGMRMKSISVLAGEMRTTQIK